MSNFNKSLLESLDTLDTFVLTETQAMKEDVEGSDDNIKVFMNTWANYNEYGADEGITPTGWMTPEEALEYAKKYADKEPFINDTDNCPWEVSEYCDLGTELPNMEAYNDFDDKTLLKNIIEVGGYGDDISAYIDIAESGDYIWFEGVDNDNDLGKAYVDMLGGLEAVSNKASYFDASAYKDDVESDMRQVYADNEGVDVDDIDEDDFETYLDSYVDEVSENWTGDDDRYFDYEKMGRELTMDGFSYTSDGALQILK